MIARPASGICHRPEAARAPISVLLPEPGPPVMMMKLSLAASKFTAQPFSLSLTALAAAKVSFFDAAIWIVSPLAGLRPSRAGLSLTLNLPKPGSEISAPVAAASVNATKTASTRSEEHPAELQSHMRHLLALL